jgi:hypothetical protein
MSEKPNENGAGEGGETDELDILIASLPSLQIPTDMVEDEYDFTPRKVKRTETDVTVIFSILAWSFLIFALLTITRAFPSNMLRPFFGESGHVSVNVQYIHNAIIYFAGNCAVCAGGLAISALKKKKMTKGNTLNFWIAGGISAVTAAVLAVIY